LNRQVRVHALAHFGWVVVTDENGVVEGCLLVLELVVVLGLPLDLAPGDHGLGVPGVAVAALLGQPRHLGPWGGLGADIVEHGGGLHGGFVHTGHAVVREKKFFLRPLFFFLHQVNLGGCVRWLVSLAWLVVGSWQWFVGSSPCEAAVVDSPLRRQLSGNLPHQCHRQALADGFHGMGFCPSMEVGRGSVCDLEEDRLG